MNQLPKHIVIITGQHMVANPRVWKEANSLISEGYKVTVLTTMYSEEKKQADKLLLDSSVKYKAMVNLIKGQGSIKEVYLSRIQKKFAILKKKYFNLDSSSLLLYLPNRQVKKALKENCDLYIAHQEAGLKIGVELLKKGKPVAFDFEDWYSNDYIVPGRPVELLKKLEKFALENAVYCSCPSLSMAEALQKFYCIKKPLQVLYNGFSQKENVQSLAFSNTMPSLVWFSQTIGPGRGLETLIESLEYIETKVELHLIGNCLKGYDAYLKREFPCQNGHALIFHSPVDHNELISVIAKYRIGLAIENNYPENKNTTISNKILQYIQAGIKILATNTNGQMEVALQFSDTVKTVPVDNAEEWAKSIEFLLMHPITEIEKQKQLETFNKIFSWETQELKLHNLLKNYFTKVIK